MMKQVKFTMPLRMLAFLCGLFLSVSAFAQQITVNGHVKDATGEPIIGATVRIAGQDGGVVSDFDGNFTITTNEGATLQISYIGYQQAVVKAAPNVMVVLKDDASQSLNEVVVIGYGVAKKSDLTGSVTAMKPDSKNKGVVVNAQDLMQGKIAGVNVTSMSGEPGAKAQIRIRGGSSLNASNDPLFVIDGVPMDNNEVNGSANILSTINPQDIESFNVLKDASATAIYGSRGSNGVIIITTKKGHKGQKPSVSYAGNVTVSKITDTHDMMNGDQYRAFVTELFGPDAEATKALGTANTDWQDLIYQTAISHDHNVTVSGSVSDFLPYRVSLGYTSQEGILKTSKYDRYTASLNLNPSFLQNHLTLNLNAKGMYSKTRKADGGAVGAAVNMDPTQDPYSFTSERNMALGSDMEKTLGNFGGFFEWVTSSSDLNDAQWPYTKHGEATANPLALLYGSEDYLRSRSFIGSADIDYKVHGFEDLRLHATLGLEIASGKENADYADYNPAYIYYGGMRNNRNFKRNQMLTAYAQYYKDFSEKYHFDIMGGYEYSRSYFSYDNSFKQFYPSTSPKAGEQVNKPEPDVDAFENYLVSFFGRANYILMNRYYFTATVRRDGSSRFEDHWGVFPSFAFAWKINDENNLRDIKWLSDLKLRLGYGETGQQEGVENYIYYVQYRKSGAYGNYPIIGDGKYYTPKYFNKKLKWETTATYNIGLDWGILDQKLSGSVDWYYRKTRDLINSAPVGSLMGFADMGLQNIGSLSNTGVEATVNWRVIQTKDWYWTLNYNFTYNHNKITDLTGVSEGGKPVFTGETIAQGNKVLVNQVGFPANSFYVFQQVYDEAGKPLEGVVVDRNGDGEITEDDRYMYKSIAAPVTMGLASRLEYKNWDFGFSLRASIGNYVFNDFERSTRLTTQNAIWGQSAFLSNRPVSTLGWSSDASNSMFSDYFVQNASFLKCDNITLGYSFNNLLKSGKWKGIDGRLYVTASNVFTITKYDGLDPEVASGIDNNLYPRPFSFVVGLNLNL